MILKPCTAIIGIIAFFFIVSNSFLSQAQDQTTLFATGGYFTSGNQNGYNLEAGVDQQIGRVFNLNVYGRMANSFDQSAEKKFSVLGGSAIFSLMLVNAEMHRVMIGTGVTYGTIKNDVDSTNESKPWWDYVKAEYDYNLQGARIGVVGSLYGGRKDLMIFAGLKFGFVF